MSKFHVGDRVRVARGATPEGGVGEGDVGVVVGRWTYGSGYQIRTDDGREGGFYKDELRPADIVALSDRGIVKDDIHTPERVLQGPTQSVPSGKEGETGRSESGGGLPTLSGDGPGLLGLSPSGPGDEDNEHLAAVRGNLGLAPDSTGDRPLRSPMRELSQEGSRGSTPGEFDPVTRPAHYNRFPVEVINITEQLDFCLGNVVKYVTRAGHKDGVPELEDLKKAQWYLNRKIASIEES